MGGYLLLFVLLVAFSTLMFRTLGIHLGTAFLVAILLVSLSACIESGWCLFVRWIVGTC